MQRPTCVTKRRTLRERYWLVFLFCAVLVLPCFGPRDNPEPVLETPEKAEAPAAAPTAMTQATAPAQAAAPAGAQGVAGGKQALAPMGVPALL